MSEGMRIRVYRNGRGGQYAVQDKVRRDAEGVSRIWWVPSYRAPGSAQWRKISGSAWHRHLINAQKELDVYAAANQLVEA